MNERPLLRVSATRLRASASSDAAMKDVNLAETNSEAEPPILWNCIGSELVFRLEFGFSC